MKKPLLLGCKGCGNAIVEMAFALAAIPIDCEEVDYSEGAATRARLLAVNPLGQVPALVLPDGRVMTESLAIIHHIHDHAPQAALIPAPGSASRDAFYRWAVFFVAAIYPTFTYGDEPRKWVRDEAGARELRETTDRRRKECWMQAEEAARSPWFLGEELSALDLYLAAMTRWRPGRKWFEENAPRIVAIAERASALPALRPVIERHFG